MFKKIWTDPVWSKVIAAGIIALCSYIGLSIFSAVKEISIKNILNFQISLKYFLLAVFLITSYIVSRLGYKPKNISIFSKVEQEILSSKDDHIDDYEAKRFQESKRNIIKRKFGDSIKFK